MTNQGKIDLERCVDQYGDMMYRFALVRVKDPAAAEDVVQSAFMAALQSRDAFEGRSTEKSWLFGILKHKIMDHFRDLKKRQSFDLPPEDGRDPLDNAFDQTGHWKNPPRQWEANPESLAENKQLAQVMAKCMDGLSDRFRRIFVLKEIDGMESEDICKEFDIQPTNLWVILHRARNQLKKCIEINWFDKTRAKDSGK
ncbi:MAG: sigma-70 family RNA polymerase sigma factor [Nitrospinae bacterium]|nr:sigma-70 family RNA polymerase sigma factor [Nitrospinota bacterium]